MALIFPSGSQLERPEENNKVIKGEDFWAYRLASDIVHDAFLRQQRIVHASELAYVAEQNRGYKDGLDRAQAESAQRMMDTVNGTVSYLTKVEQQFATLVFDAVKQVISDYDDKEKTIAVVKAGMNAMRGQKHIVLKVNPENLEMVQAELRTLHQAFPMVTHVEAVAQPDVPKDACIVNTEIGSAEASISAQLKALNTSLGRVFGLSANALPQETGSFENEAMATSAEWNDIDD